MELSFYPLIQITQHPLSVSPEYGMLLLTEDQVQTVH